MSAQDTKPFYFAILSGYPHDQFKFTDVEDMRNFLIKNPDVKELLHTGLPGIKIKFDTGTGKVEGFFPVKESQSDVKTSYASEAFEKKSSEIEKAICRLAKHELLRKLSELNDPGITNVLNEYELKFDRQAYNSSVAVDKALEKIKNLIKPEEERILSISLPFFSANKNNKPSEKSVVQRAVYLAFKEQGIYEHGIDHINSMGRVTDIIHTISMHKPTIRP